MILVTRNKIFEKKIWLYNSFRSFRPFAKRFVRAVKIAYHVPEGISLTETFFQMRNSLFIVFADF